MDKRFAVGILKQFKEKPILINSIETQEETIWFEEALDLAIKALEEQPCEDAISRQAVINAIANTCFWLSADNWEELIKCINSISPVTPAEKREPCEDAINRDDVIELIAGADETDGNEPVFSGKQIIKMLKSLPSVTPIKI